MKKVVLLLLVGMLLASCGPRESAALPASAIPGYWTAGQSMSGGKEDENLNLASVNAAVNGGETRISLSFLSGSSQAGDEKALNVAPVYTASILPGPSRVKITLPLAYEEYADDLPEPAGLFFGMFSLPGTQEGTTELYFQFTGKIGLRVEEQQGALILLVQPDDPDEADAYLSALAYGEEARPIAQGNGLTPVLCDDGTNMLFISDPFATLEEADALSLSLNEQLGAAGLNDRAGSTGYRGNWAPTYRANLSVMQLAELGALVTPEGEEIIAEPWAVNARFLCWLPDGRGLCACPEEIEDGTSIERLWAFDADGSRMRYIKGDYRVVDRATVSPDGQYVSFIERVDAQRLLYVYDVAGDVVEFLPIEGMGDFTAGYAWGADGVLYALSGQEEMRLMAFDPRAAADSEDRVRAVEEENAPAGSVYWADGAIYRSGEGGSILSVDPATGESAAFAEGGGFSVSPDGLHMLITYAAEGSEAETQTGVKMRDMATGAERTLTTDLPYLGGSWSSDGTVFGYLVANRAAAEDDEEGAEEGEEEQGMNADYPARLYTCVPSTGEYVLRGMLVSDSIYAGRTPGEVILVAYARVDEGTMMPVTYRLELGE